MHKFSSNDNNWDAPIENPPFWCAGLLRPKPDRAYGFKVLLTHDEPHPLLSLYVLSALEEDGEINLHPRPSPHTLGGLAYPGLIHEVKDENGTQRFAENQLAKSLAFALAQQKELREAALAIDPNIDKRRYELPIIGVTSVGPTMSLFYAFEGPNEEVVSARLPSRSMRHFSNLLTCSLEHCSLRNVTPPTATSCLRLSPVCSISRAMAQERILRSYS